MKSPLSSRKPRSPRVKLRRIVGDSMLPTLQPGQIVVLAVSRRLRVGDIVMVRHAGVEKIKRIARLDGGRVYVLGDNPAASTDSRSFGWLGIESVSGVLLWPRQPRKQVI